VRAEAPGGFEPASLRRWIAPAVVAALLLAVLAMVIGRELVSPDAPDRPARAARTAKPDFVRFQDPAGGISIVRPAAWRQLTPPNPEVRLLAEGDDASMLVRLTNLGVKVGPRSLGRARKLTDKLVRSAGQAKPLRRRRRVTLGGLPGYLYLYTFRDSSTGERGAHAHYFLFRGKTLITIVFQTASAERLARFAPLFDRLGGTLQSTPG